MDNAQRKQPKNTMWLSPKSLVSLTTGLLGLFVLVACVLFGMKQYHKWEAGTRVAQLERLWLVSADPGGALALQNAKISLADSKPRQEMQTWVKSHVGGAPSSQNARADRTSVNDFLNSVAKRDEQTEDFVDPSTLPALSQKIDRQDATSTHRRLVFVSIFLVCGVASIVAILYAAVLLWQRYKRISTGSDLKMLIKPLQNYKGNIEKSENISRVRDQFIAAFNDLENTKTPLRHETWKELVAETERVSRAKQGDLAPRRTKILALMTEVIKQVTTAQGEPSVPKVSPAIRDLPSFDDAQVGRSLSSSPQQPPALQMPSGAEPASARKITDLEWELNKKKEEVAGLQTQVGEYKRQLEQRQAISSSAQSTLSSELARERAISRQLEDDLQAARQRAEQDVGSAKRETEKASALATGEAQKAKVAQEQIRLFTDANAALAYLHDRVDAFPSKLSEYTTQLLKSFEAVSPDGTITNAVSTGKTDDLKKNLKFLDWVYDDVPSVARLMEHGGSSVDSLVATQSIAVLQKSLSVKLKSLKLTPIDPARGDAYDTKLHYAAEGEHYEWTSDRSLDNQVHKVIRIGYAYQGKALREAVVRRYVYLSAAGDAEPRVDKAQEASEPEAEITTVASKEEHVDSVPASVDLESIPIQETVPPAEFPDAPSPEPVFERPSSEMNDVEGYAPASNHWPPTTFDTRSVPNEVPPVEIEHELIVIEKQEAQMPIKPSPEAVAPMIIPENPEETDITAVDDKSDEAEDTHDQRPETMLTDFFGKR